MKKTKKKKRQQEGEGRLAIGKKEGGSETGKNSKKDRKETKSKPGQSFKEREEAKDRTEKE